MSNTKKENERFSIMCNNMNEINEIKAFYSAPRRIITFEQWKQKHAGDGGSNKAWGGFGGAFGIGSETKGDDNG